MSATELFQLSLTRLKAVMWVFVSVAFWAFAPSSDAHAANAPETFVQSNIDKSYAILNDGTSDPAQRRVQFRALLLSMVDVKRVALFTLGTYARDAGEADIEKFTAAFADYLTGVYLRGLETYKTNALEVTGSTEHAQDDVIVNVVAGGRGAKSSQAQIGFRVRRAKSGENIVTDLEIEGAWLALMQRAEFTAYLKQHGGNIADLSIELDARVTRILVADSGPEKRGKR